MKQIKFISLFKLFKDNIVQESMISLNNSLELLALYRKLGWRVVRTIFTSKVKTQSRMRTMYTFFQHILTLRKVHGDEYVVKYLKLSQLVIQKCIAGERISSMRELEPSISFPRLSKSGLPVAIPLQDRRAIMNRSTLIIRFWLTLFSIYRIVTVPGKPKLQTITDPYSGSVVALGRVSDNLRVLARKFSNRFPNSVAKRDLGISLIESSSPSSPVSWVTMFKTPFDLSKAGLGQVFLDYMDEMGYSKSLQIWVTIFKHFKVLDKFIPFIPNPLVGPLGKELMNHKIGKLSTKKEAAGKVRVFAMVDVWTQSLLKPLHLALFEFLKSLPNDGTFDQNASWKRCAVKAGKSGCSFGYDLSAATDRLPITLQVSILESFIGARAAKLWKSMLVDRDYFLTEMVSVGKEKEKLSTPYRYAVGQPMGALSSWAMLAVTHHLIVQLAYRIARPTGLVNEWYDNYEIIGDDVNIFDKDVAEAYLGLMAEIGVPINLSKSVVAVNPTTEFAKVTTHYGKNVSAVSWKMFISQNTMTGRIGILWSLLNKDYLPTSHLGEWLKDVCAKRRYDKGLDSLVYFPILAMFAYQGRIRYEDLIRSLFTKDLESSNTSKALIRGVNSEYLRNLVVSLIKGKELRLMSLPDTWNKELAILKAVMIAPIRRAPSMDPPRKSKELASEIFAAMYPYLVNNVKIWDTVLQVQWSEVLSAQVDLTGIIRDILFDALTAADVDLPFNYLKLSVEELLVMRDSSEKGSQILTLLPRTKEALIKKGQVKEKTKTALTVVLDVLRMRKLVATWPHMRYESEKASSQSCS